MSPMMGKHVYHTEVTSFLPQAFPSIHVSHGSFARALNSTLTRINVLHPLVLVGNILMSHACKCFALTSL